MSTWVSCKWSKICFKAFRAWWKNFKHVPLSLVSHMPTPRQLFR